MGASGSVAHLDLGCLTGLNHWKRGITETTHDIKGVFGINISDIMFDIYAVTAEGEILHYEDLPEKPKLTSPTNNSAIGD